MRIFNARIFYIKRKIIFPYCTMTVRLRDIKLNRDIKKGDKILARPVRILPEVLLFKNRMATLSEVVNISREAGVIILTLKGLIRVKIAKTLKFRSAEFSIIENINIDSAHPLIEELRKKSQELIFLINVDESDRLIDMVNFISDMHQITDFIAHYFVIDFKNRLKLYREIDIEKRSIALLKMIDGLIDKFNRIKRGELNEKN